MIPVAIVYSESSITNIMQSLVLVNIIEWLHTIINIDDYHNYIMNSGWIILVIDDFDDSLFTNIKNI